MKVLVESLDAQFDHLKPAIKKSAVQVANFLKQKNVYLEVYLLPNRMMNKNVLSFPAPKDFPRPDMKRGMKYLGEIYLNPDYIRREQLEIENLKFLPLPVGRQVAVRHGKISAKLAFMLIHGFLHLLGYLHDKKSDRIKMRNKEKELLRLLNIKI